MATATEHTESLAPPRSETGWIGWARFNLFGSWSSSIVTVVSVPLALWACWAGLSWLFTTSDWTLVTSRPQQYFIGIYPTEHAWRPLVGWLMVSVLFGLAAGMWKGAAERIAIGYGAVVLVGGLVPYGMLHEGVNMPLDIRLLVLGNLPVLAVSYWLGTAERGGLARWLIVAALGVYALSLLVLAGLSGAGLVESSSQRVWVVWVLNLILSASGVVEPFSQSVWVVWVLNLILSASGIALSFPVAIPLARKVGRPRWLVVGGLVAYALFLLLLIGLPGVMEPVSPRVWGGLMLNLILSVSGIVLSFPIGVALALGRRSNLPVVKLLCVAFIEIFRGVPLITLLFVSQVLVPLALPDNFPVNSVTRAAIVITLFSSAYMAENIRGGLQGLPTGQAEAARALGLPGWQVTVLILLPQAVRNVIPAIVGQFIALFKDTSLVYIVGMLDILEIGRAIVQGNVEFADNGRELYIFVAVVFWLITYTMSYASRSLERHLGVGER